MTTKIVTDEGLALESSVAELRSLVALAQWVEQARALLEHVKTAAKNDKQFSARLEREDVRVGSADFEPVHSDGLQALLFTIEGKLSDMGAALAAERAPSLTQAANADRAAA